ncbi:hypothetical protein [uncultured Nonlabens sp.]|uniref:hypothetical protein n=1 Tax=uncultured Nonlabens sp. TaxID=859306 RepID=UPI00260BEC0F|nr:hypothetical protein [uncultured Nonlabens sp.]
MNNLLYFDAGLGMMIAQGAIATVAGFVLFYKKIITILQGWLGIRKAAKENSFDSNYNKDTEIK